MNFHDPITEHKENKMATFTITIPDGKVTEILEAFADEHGWGGAGTKAQFAKKTILGFIRKTHADYKNNLIEVTKEQAAADSADYTSDVDVS